MYILYPILYESRPEIVISNKFKSQVLVTFIGDQKISSNTQLNPALTDFRGLIIFLLLLNVDRILLFLTKEIKENKWKGLCEFASVISGIPSLAGPLERGFQLYLQRLARQEIDASVEIKNSNVIFGGTKEGAP